MVTKPHKGATIAIQPRIRKGAFFDAAWRHGCRKFSVYNRTYISSTFSDPTDEDVLEALHICFPDLIVEKPEKISIFTLLLAALINNRFRDRGF